MHIEHTVGHERAAQELDPTELAAVGGGSPIGYAVGYAVGYLTRVVMEWEPSYHVGPPFGGMA